MARPSDVLKLRHEVHHGRVVRAYVGRPDNVSAMFAQAVGRAADTTACVDGDDRPTYREFQERVLAAAARLAECGVSAGDRIALLIANRCDFLAALLACSHLGAICVPMNIRQKARETAYILEDCGAALLIHEKSLQSELPALTELPSLRRTIAIDDGRPLWAGYSAGQAGVATQLEEDSPFCILYTSGTTGRPKGAILTHFGTVTSCIGAQQHLDLHDGEITILAVPASHVTGVILILLLMVRAAGTTVFQRAFKARHFLETAAAERMSYVIIVPAMYNLCLREPDFAKFDLSHWRVGSFGGAPMPASVLETLAATNPNLAMHNVYGATETTSPAVIMPASETRSRLGQVGKPLSYCDIVVLDERGREVPTGEQGEIWISGPNVVPGYWGNDAATASSIVNGYWKSGDIGSMDADGYLTLHDRVKDMINRAGYKVYSVEVENVLASHPSIIEAGVIGRPCPVLGERVEAYVVSGDALDEAELRQFCSRQLSDYKVPDHIYFIDGALPRNANGKLMKAVLREWDQAAQRQER